MGLSGKAPGNRGTVGSDEVEWEAVEGMLIALWVFIWWISGTPSPVDEAGYTGWFWAMAVILIRGVTNTIWGIIRFLNKPEFEG